MIAYKGETVTCENGHAICEVAQDINRFSGWARSCSLPGGVTETQPGTYASPVQHAAVNSSVHVALPATRPRGLAPRHALAE